MQPAVPLATDAGPLVTTIIPSYNHERYVERSIESVLRQTYRNLQVIIIDDGSTDGTAQVVERTLAAAAGDRDVTFLRQSNKGVSATLNRGLALAKGSYVQFVASDDAYLPEKTARCVGLLHKAPDSVVGVYTDGYVIDDAGQRLMRFSQGFPWPLLPGTHAELVVGNWIPAMGLMYRTAAVLEAQGFDESLRIEDYDLLLRITRGRKLLRSREPLFLYRRHETNYSKKVEAMQAGMEQLCRKHPDLQAFHELAGHVNARRFGAALRAASLGGAGWLLRSRLRTWQAGRYPPV
jgi:alpha-1,3-rhamnosyltransferase